MKRNCMNCGALLEDGAKICSNCGRMVYDGNKNVQAARLRASKGRASGSKGRQSADISEYSSALKTKPRRGGADLGRDPGLENLKFQKTGGSGNSARGKLAPFAGKILKIILVLAIAYFAFAFIRITMTKNSTYKFETDMELPCEDYGEAMDSYFEDGGWHFELFRNRVSYKGTIKKKKYLLTFKRENGQTVVDMLTIDGEEVDKDIIMEEYVLGMFMSGEKEEKGVKGAFRPT